MSILVEIAQKANVSVEGVVRVLTREPVSDGIKEQVLAVLDDLTPAQTRVLQRFALAAIYDELPHPAGAVDVEPAGLPEPPRALIGPGDETGEEAGDETGEEVAVLRAEVQSLEPLRSVLTELGEAIRDLRRETDAERRERVDDLSVVIDLISTGWQGIERRLGRIEQHLGQLETARREPPEPRGFRQRPPAEPAPAPALPQPEAEVPAEEEEAEDGDSRRKSRLISLATAVGVVGAIALTFVLIDTLAGRSDAPRLLPATVAEDAASTVPPRASSATSTKPNAKTTTGDTSVVLGTVDTEPAEPAEPAAPESAEFRPARQWAWAPVTDADYYVVEFRRDGKAFFGTHTVRPRLTLPVWVEFTPGSYRWTVRPGYGTRAANELGPPLVDSAFSVS